MLKLQQLPFKVSTLDSEVIYLLMIMLPEVC